MVRTSRIDVGGYVYHCLNRANAKARIFETEREYQDFEYLLTEMSETFDMRILAYVVMPNHWHILTYPKNDGDLARSFKWLGTSHATRHRARTDSVGAGHLYQGRYKSFLIENDHHLLTVLKYIERNPVRAGLVRQPGEWRWSSAYRRLRGTATQKKLLAESPVDLPRNYQTWIEVPEPSEERDEIHRSIQTGRSYGKPVIDKQ